MKRLAIATALAAAAAFLGNRLLLRLQGRWALVTLIPLWEEACKGLAVWALPARPVLLVHVLFGLLEFGYSAWRGERFLGLVGLSIHGLVGGVAAWLAIGNRLPGGPVSGAPGGGAAGAEALTIATLGACLLHVLLNLAVLGLVFPTLGLPVRISHFQVDPRLGGRYNEQE